MQTLIMTQCDCHPLLNRELGQGGIDVPTDVLGLNVGEERGSGVPGFRDIIQRHTARAPKMIEAEIERDAVQPGTETGGGLPACRMRPEAEKGILCHIFSAGVIAEHTSGERHHASDVSLDETAKRVTIARAHLEHESFI